MREIKFRGKTANGEWVYGSLVHSENIQPAIYFEVGKGSIKTFDFVYVKPETVGQFTGLHDGTTWEELDEQERKHWVMEGNMPSEWKGKKIYEGDIIKHNNTHFVVEFSANHLGFICIDRKHKTRGGFANWRDGNWMKNVSSYIQVIGAIHNNPELLKA